MYYSVVLVCAIFELYGMHDELAKDAFLQLDKPQQQLICQSLKQQKPFTVSHSGHAVQMMKIQGDGRVRIFKGSFNFEVLLSAFNKLCSEQI